MDLGLAPRRLGALALRAWVHKPSAEGCHRRPAHAPALNGARKIRRKTLKRHDSRLEVTSPPGVL